MRDLEESCQHSHGKNKKKNKKKKKRATSSSSESEDRKSRARRKNRRSGDTLSNFRGLGNRTEKDRGYWQKNSFFCAKWLILCRFLNALMTTFKKCS
jgi:hypothetical protein